jgi:hypothetical protein
LLSGFTPPHGLRTLNQELLLQPALVQYTIKQPSISPLEVLIPRVVQEAPARLAISRIVLKPVKIDRWNNVASLLVWIYT